MKRLNLELTDEQADVTIEFLRESLSDLAGVDDDDELDLVLIKVLARMRAQLGGDRESKKGVGRSLRGARRLS